MPTPIPTQRSERAAPRSDGHTALTFSNVHALANEAAGSEDGPELPAAWTRWDLDDDLPPDEAARRAVEAGADLVVACGGDGTVSAAAGVLAGTDAVLAIVPAGTANVFASGVMIPADCDEAVELADGAHPTKVRLVDVAWITAEGAAPHASVLRLGLGVQAAMVTDVDDDLKSRWGRIAYAIQFWRETRNETRVRYHFDIDGAAHTVEGVSCLVCNSVSAGMRGVHFFHDAALDDGCLDVAVARSLSFWALLRILAVAVWSALCGRGFHVEESDLVTHLSGQTVCVEAEPVQQAAIDGEPYDAPYPYRVEAQKQALRLLVPAGADPRGS